MRATLRVAIIDDNRDQCLTLADILNDANCEAISCWESDKAIELCNGERFDLIILDIKMPDISGLEVLSAISAANHGCVVVATGWEDEDLRRQCLAAGADEVMLKPLDIPRLLEIAREVRQDGDCRTKADTSVAA